MSKSDLGAQRASQAISSPMPEPSRPDVVEVLFSWRERVLGTYHFEVPRFGSRVVTMGSHPSCDLTAPTGSGVARRWPLLTLGSRTTRVRLPSGLKAEVEREGHLIKAPPSLTLLSSDVIRLQLTTDTSITIQHVRSAPRAKLAPFPLLEPAEYLASTVAAISGVFMFFSPPDRQRRAAQETPELVVRFEPKPAPKPPPVEVKPPPVVVETKPEPAKRARPRPTSEGSRNAVSRKPPGTGLFEALGANAKGESSNTLIAIAGNMGRAGNASGTSNVPTLRTIEGSGIGERLADGKLTGLAPGKRVSGGPGLGDKAGTAITIAREGIEASDVTIDREAIRRVVLANLGAIKACYNQALNRAPRMSGKIVMSWEVGGAGHVTSARVESATPGTQEVGNCIGLRLRTWEFPVPPAGATYSVQFPFVLSSAQ